MRELSLNEIENVSGGLSASDGGIAIIALGLAGGVATGGFGLLVGGALLYLGAVGND